MDYLTDIVFWLGLFVTVGYCFWLEHRCNHKWKTIQTTNLYTNPKDIPTGRLFVLECQNCGKIDDYKLRN